MTDTVQNKISARRIGQYLLDAGVLTQDQLQEALDRQKRMSRAGFHVLLGTILEEMGVLDRQSLEAVILRQRLDEGSVSLGTAAEWTSIRPPPAPGGERQFEVLQSSEVGAGDFESSIDRGTPALEAPGQVAPEPSSEVAAPEATNSAPVDQPVATAPTEPSVPPHAAPAGSAAAMPSMGTATLHGFTFTRLADGGLPENQVGPTLAQVLRRAKSLEDDLRALNERTEHLESLSKLAEQTIKAADTIAEQIHEEAEKQASAIRDRAQQEAKRIIADARARHEQIVRQSVDKARQLSVEIRQNIEDQQNLNNRLHDIAERILNDDGEGTTD